MKNILISIFCLFLSVNPSALFGQLSGHSIAQLEQKLDSVIQSGLENQQIPGLAFVIVEGNNVLIKKGYGLSSFENGIGFIDPDSSIIRIGSITKTFTAMALLHLFDQNQLDLHADVNEYLTSVEVPNTFQKPITPAHLINHSAGLDELPGRLVFSEEDAIPLADFLDERIVRLRQPGVFTSYSTYGIALAGLLVEEVSGMSLESYMKQNIWEPLGMSMTSITLPEEHESLVSPGYELENGVNDPQPWEWYHTYPASSINSTVSDMEKYIMMHLAFGKFDENSILSEESARAMQTQQLSVHPDVDGFGYGFYQDLVNGLNTFGHGGDMLGYSAFMSLVPEKNLGVFVISHHEGSRLRFNVLRTVMQHLNKNEIESSSKKMIDADLSRFEGSYRWSTYCHSCSENYYPEAQEIIVDPVNQTLSGFGRVFYQVKPLLFRSTDGLRIMGFKEDEQGKITYMSLGNSNTFEMVD